MSYLTLPPAGLRVHGSTPSLLERVIPSCSSKNGTPNESFDLMGYALPPGTIVATQAWSMHRDPSVFPSPSTFLPDRWLQTHAPDNTEQLAQMQQHYMPFGTGSRGCGGQNLAMMMLRITVAAIARNFDIAAPAETNDKSMEVRDSFVRCLVPRFVDGICSDGFVAGYVSRSYGVQAYFPPPRFVLEHDQLRSTNSFIISILSPIHCMCFISFTVR